MDIQQKHQQLFLEMVLMLHAAAMQQMGKIANPLSQKIERDLAGAQSTIDMLDMFEDRTRGNLSKDEEKVLKQVLQELKLNYVDEFARAPSSQSNVGPDSTGSGSPDGAKGSAS